MRLYLLKNFNNYYNRIVKRFETLIEYLPYVDDSYTDINFNPNDGISTTQIVNRDYYKENTDYVVVTDDNGNILSRWFIIKSTRTRSMQYQLDLYRDVITDWWNTIVSSPMYIEKGYLPSNDLSIFNAEDIATSQLKKKETLLKDATSCPWVVGYIAAPKDGVEPINVTYGLAANSYDITTANLSVWPYYKYTTTPCTDISDVWYDIGATKQGTIDVRRFQISGDGSRVINPGYQTNIGLYYKASTKIDGLDFETYFLRSAWDAIPDGMYTDFINQYELVDSRYTKVLALDGLVLKDISTNKFYRIHVTKGSAQTFKIPARGTQTFQNFETFRTNFVNPSDGSMLFQGDPYIAQDVASSSYKVNYTSYSASISLEDITYTAGGGEFTITNNRRILKDAAYCMFAIPYSNDFKVITTPAALEQPEVSFTTSKENALTIASGIMIHGSSNVYDVQLLPYCPFANLKTEGPEVDISRLVQDVDYILPPNSDQIILFCQYSKGTFNIEYTQEGLSSDAIETKAKACTRFSRICSPNYNGIFEYSPIKNHGVSYFNVDYTYKPYNPYIHINPNFNGLYVADYDDTRGLICSGDFSLTSLSSAWADYELQNKNYDSIFRRGIEKLELEQKYAKVGDIANAITGTFTGATTGAGIGGMVGGGIGAAVGGVVGGVTSGIGGIVDVSINNKLRAETLDYTKDMYGFQLDNIKAIPYSITKVSSFTNNNKLFPFIEDYECSSEEYQAVIDKIHYNGMTINRIGNLNLYLGFKPTSIDLGYYKGRLIRFLDEDTDYNIVKAISDELNRGIYI